MRRPPGYGPAEEQQEVILGRLRARFTVIGGRNPGAVWFRGNEGLRIDVPK